MIDRQSFTISLPDGTSVTPISGSVTIDETWTPYIQGRVQIPAPSSLSAFDPRTGALPTVVTVRQEFNDPTTVGDLSGSMAALTAAYGGHPLSFITATFTVLWNAGDYRPAVIRTLNLQIRSRTRNPDGTLELVLESDDTALQDYGMLELLNYSGPSLNVGPATLAALVKWVVSKVNPSAEFAEITTDLNLAAFSLNYTGRADGTGIIWYQGISAWDFITDFLQMAAARLWTDEFGYWHLTPDPVDRATTTTVSTGVNLVGYADTIDRNESDFANCVVLKYSFQYPNTDGTYVTGEKSEVADGSAGSARRVKIIERDAGIFAAGTPIIPVGAAAYALAVALRLGHATSVDALSDFNATPGNALDVNLYGSTAAGHVSSVTFNFDSGEMNIRARDIT